MVTELASTGTANEIWVAEFGVLSDQFLDFSRAYQGRLYKLSAETLKTVSELMGFTCNFELPAIRTAYMDVCKTEGQVVFEIERNTKPADVSVRYMRDRWQVLELTGKGSEGLRPWIKTEYQARFLPDKVLVTLAEQLKIKAEDIVQFFIRINFRERTYGLILEEKNAEMFPTGAFAWCRVQPTVPAVATSELTSDAVPDRESSGTTSGVAAAKAQRVPDRLPYAAAAASSARLQSEGQAKYATYSRSEIDNLLKQQGESILNALTGKLSAQQRAFQEAVEKQEKAFSKISDNITAQFDAARVKLEATTRSAKDQTHSEIEEFHKILSKELDQYRTQINRTVLPVAKALEDKSAKQPPKEQKPTAPAKAHPQDAAFNKRMLTAILAVALLSLAVSLFNLATIANAGGQSGKPAGNSSSAQ